MVFEYDPRKSASNKIKHGIDFDEAQDIWFDDDAIAVPSNYEGEDRSLLIGSVDGQIWTAIITFRDEVTRIISVRRARKYEEQAYDNSRRT